MAQKVTLSFRVSEEKVAALDQLAKDTDRSRSYLLEKALERYIQDEAWQIARIKEGLAQLDRGEYVDHEKVMAWLESWGTDDELDPPTCG